MRIRSSFPTKFRGGTKKEKLSLRLGHRFPEGLFSGFIFQVLGYIRLKQPMPGIQAFISTSLKGSPGDHIVVSWTKMGLKKSVVAYPVQRHQK